MRVMISKLLTGSMVVGAALVVSACGGSEKANTVENTTTVSDMDGMAPVDGATNDVTAVDGAGTNAMTGNMSADANMTMGTNSMSEGNMTSGNMSGANLSGGNVTINTATGNMTNAM